jgi:Zn-dependent peptidase ImmA (M78 family)
VDSTAKGNKLEDALYRYLLDQQERGEMVFGAHLPSQCKIFKKKRYGEGRRSIQFDIVIEVYRVGRDTAHCYIVFECKNYAGAVPEKDIAVFSNQLVRTFPHSAKGIVVIASRLQSGAKDLARGYGMGIVKYDEHGFDVIAERKGSYVETGYVRDQLFESPDARRSLKFSASYNGRFFGAARDLVAAIAFDGADQHIGDPTGGARSIPFISREHIKAVATKLLDEVGYKTGTVDLDEICRLKSIALKLTNEKVFDIDGREILGSADFGRRAIEVNSHALETRERFTIGHEIGHFVLGHGEYLRSESVIENDILIASEKTVPLNVDRLEYQANIFSAELILPEAALIVAIATFRRDLGIRNRGHGYIFVDNQPGNLSTYYDLIGRIETHFSVSRQVIEIKIRALGMLNDQRKAGPMTHLPSLISDVIRRDKS